MLSEKNREKINERALYRANPMPELLPSYKRNDPYHCINWTFRPVIDRDGNVSMHDTYFSSSTLVIDVTDENIDLFEKLFDFDSVIDYGTRCPKEYDKSDYYCAPVDSGGTKWSHYFLKKGAKPSADIIAHNTVGEIQDLRRQLSWKLDELKRATKAAGQWGFILFTEEGDVLYYKIGLTEATDAVKAAFDAKSKINMNDVVIEIAESEDVCRLVLEKGA